MTWSVGLQEPFDFAMKWVVIGILLIAGSIVLRYLLRHSAAVWRAFRRLFHARWIQKLLLGPRRRRYTKHIRKVEKELVQGVIDKRAAYLRMSAEIREFIRVTTGVRVDNMSFEEIRALGNAPLTDLVGECYVPEFAYMSDAEARATLDRCKELIRTWR